MSFGIWTKSSGSSWSGTNAIEHSLRQKPSLSIRLCVFAERFLISAGDLIPELWVGLVVAPAIPDKPEACAKNLPARFWQGNRLRKRRIRGVGHAHYEAHFPQGAYIAARHRV